MGIQIPALLEAILEATATKTGAEARIAGLRKVLDDEARRRYADEGAAPSWKRRDLGAVRLDEPGAWAATVADPAAFGSYIAQHHPTEATGVIEVPADRLEETLAAIGFAGIDVVDTRVEVRPLFATKYLEALIVDVEETLDEDGSVDRAITVVDPATGAIVDGTSATRSPAKLVVTLDRDLRAQVIDRAKADAEALLDAVLDLPPEQPPAVGREVTLEELTAAGVVRPAAELTAPERAIVDRFEAAPDALTDEKRAPTEKAPVAAVSAGQTEKSAGHRLPYVGEGADGARRSAEIDRTEAEGLDPFADAERYADVMRSAERWEQQARELDSHGPHGNASTVSLGEALAMQDPEHGIAAVEAMDNREALRRLARAKGIPAGGTKRELAERLYAAGVRA